MRTVYIVLTALFLSACLGQDRMELIIHDDQYMLDGVALASAYDVRTKVLETDPELFMVLACPGVDKKRIMDIVDPLRISYTGELVYSKKRSGCP